MKTVSLCLVLLLGLTISSVWATDRLRGVKSSEHNLFQGEFIECDGGKKVPVSHVNDDFCDCEDGKDEPGTSACPRGRFFCVNKGFRGVSIPSAWVDDGRCDCCDGSDESKKQCANTCNESAKQHLAKVAGEIAVQERGLALREAYVAHAQNERTRYLELVAKTEKKVEELEEQAEALEKVKIAAEEAYAAAHAKADERINAEDAEKMKSATETKDAADEETAKEEEDNDFSIDDEPDVKPLKEDKEKAVLAWSDAKQAKDDAQRELDGYRKFTNTDFGPDLAYHALYDATYEFSDKEYTYKFHAFTDVQQTKPGHSSNLGKWKGWDQSKPNVMLYENGDRCWGAPDRSTKVTLICGDEHKVIDVKEPNKCEYTLTVKTPAACSKATLEALKNGE